MRPYARTIMISDIHGCLEPLNRLLEAVSYQPNEDRLFLLGDYVDRGPDSREVVDRVMELVEKHGAVALRGNHDQRLVDFARGRDPEVQAKLLEHGGLATLRSYCPFVGDQPTDDDLDRARAYLASRYDAHLAFLSELPLYHEDEDHIYVHAGLNPRYADWKTQSDRDFMYIKGEFIRSRTNLPKKVVFGHTVTDEIHDSCDVWFGGDKIGIDGGCAYGEQLNALIYENGSYRTERVSQAGGKPNG